MTRGERIRNLRKERNIPQAELARRVGISKQTLYKYETGIVTNIPSDTIEIIAKHLNTTPQNIMGWEDNKNFKPPIISTDTVTFPVIGEIAAGYDNIALEDWSGETIEIPATYLNGHNRNEYFVLTVKGDSMYPLYVEGDKVLILKQTTLNYSGEVGAILYEDFATLKKVEFVQGENWLKMIAINPNYPPRLIENEALEQCRVIGIPKLLVREIDDMRIL